MKPSPSRARRRPSASGFSRFPATTATSSSRAARRSGPTPRAGSSLDASPPSRASGSVSGATLRSPSSFHRRCSRPSPPCSGPERGDGCPRIWPSRGPNGWPGTVASYSTKQSESAGVQERRSEIPSRIISPGSGIVARAWRCLPAWLSLDPGAGRQLSGGLADSNGSPVLGGHRPRSGVASGPGSTVTSQVPGSRARTR
jgi:hypothetical protein